MFDTSWTEILVVFGVGCYLCGRKDLPRVANFCGTQVGRVVGFLQGAKARARRLSTTQELQQLQSQLKMGLRELEAVKAELAVSMTPNMSHSNEVVGPRNHTISAHSRLPHTFATTKPQLLSSPTALPLPPPSPTTTAILSSTEYQAKAAVAEQEWASRNMQFRSRGEQAYAKSNNALHGSALLSHLLQQSLVFDQYDRVMAEQNDMLQKRMEAVEAKQRQQEQENTDHDAKDNQEPNQDGNQHKTK